MPSQTFRRGEDELQFLIAGQGATRIVFLHGAFGRKEFWQAQLDFFQTEFEVCAPDLLGHGQSSPLSPENAVIENARMLH